MAQQTAVDWLFEQYKKHGILFSQDEEQAKQMFEEQIIQAWMATDNELQRIAAEQYYTETYGK